MSRKALGFFQILMINIIAVGSVRTLPFSSIYGVSLIFFYLLSAALFFFPTALVSAELGTGWPRTGGIYVWVREAFGEKCSFVVIWLIWSYNVIWYPTILALIAGTITYLFNPDLATNRLYMSLTVIGLFWLSTWFNLYGMRLSSWVSTLGVFIGNLFPMILIICLGGFWLLSKSPVATDFFRYGAIPSLDVESNLSFLTTIFFGLLGLEMSATHAADMKNPARDYPKAVFTSACLILVMLMLGSLSISIVVPTSELNLATGIMQAFTIFLETFHLKLLTPFVAFCVVLGGISAIGAWVIGPTKGLMVALEDWAVCQSLARKNRHGVPSRILVLQAVTVSVLSLSFVLFPTVNSSFWFLSVITAQLALVVYVFLFLSALRLRYRKPEIKRHFTIPLGKVGIWTVCLAGALSCCFVIGIGFSPPKDIVIESVWLYEVGLVSCLLIFSLTPLFLLKRLSKKKP